MEGGVGVQRVQQPRATSYAHMDEDLYDDSVFEAMEHLSLSLVQEATGDDMAALPQRSFTPPHYLYPYPDMPEQQSPFGYGPDGACRNPFADNSGSEVPLSSSFGDSQAHHFTAKKKSAELDAARYNSAAPSFHHRQQQPNTLRQAPNDPWATAPAELQQQQQQQQRGTAAHAHQYVQYRGAQPQQMPPVCQHCRHQPQQQQQQQQPQEYLEYQRVRQYLAPARHPLHDGLAASNSMPSSSAQSQQQHHNPWAMSKAQHAQLAWASAAPSSASSSSSSSRSAAAFFDNPNADPHAMYHPSQRQQQQQHEHSQYFRSPSPFGSSFAAPAAEYPSNVYGGTRGGDDFIPPYAMASATAATSASPRAPLSPPWSAASKTVAATVAAPLHGSVGDQLTGREGADASSSSSSSSASSSSLARLPDLESFMDSTPAIITAASTCTAATPVEVAADTASVHSDTEPATATTAPGAASQLPWVVATADDAMPTTMAMTAAQRSYSQAARGPATTTATAPSAMQIASPFMGRDTDSDDGGASSTTSNTSGSDLAMPPQPMAAAVAVSAAAPHAQAHTSSSASVPMQRRQRARKTHKQQQQQQQQQRRGLAAAPTVSAALATKPAPPSVDGAAAASLQQRYVFIDNGNIFVGAQSLANGTMDLAIRLNVRMFSELIEEKSTCVTREVAASRPSNPQICNAWRKINYSVFNDARNQTAHQIVTARIAAVIRSSRTPHTLVLATGDGSQYPDLAAMAASKRWKVIVWSWNRCLSDKFRKLQTRFPNNVEIRALDGYRSQITFMANNGRRGDGQQQQQQQHGGEQHHRQGAAVSRSHHHPQQQQQQHQHQHGSSSSRLSAGGRARHHHHHHYQTPSPSTLRQGHGSLQQPRQQH